MSDSPKKFLCFVCLKESEQSNVCTHCGATIEEIDPDAAIIRPPRWGTFQVHFKDIALDAANAALSKAIALHYQLAKVAESANTIDVRATDRGHEGFIGVTAEMLGVPATDVLAKVPFSPDDF